MTMISAAVTKVLGWITGLFSWASKAGYKKDKDGKDVEWSLITIIEAASSGDTEGKE